MGSGNGKPDSDMKEIDNNLRSRLERFLEQLEKRAGEEDYSLRTTYPYLLGVYLGVNALKDAFLLVEGPDCSYMKIQYIQGNHDWLSTLSSVSGFHRVANTALHPAMMSDSREEPLLEIMKRIASHEATGALLLTSMPMAFVTGADYERLCRDVSRTTGKEVLFVPGLSLSGDWLDGYAEFLKSLAKQLDLSAARTRPDSVAIVGYLFDRNEDDHRANVEELRGMCEAVGVRLVSVWLSGQRWADLKAIRDAGVILSLPYARKAAQYVARQTGAEVISMPLPFGLKACEHWMRTLAERFDAQRAARSYMDGMMRRIAPKVEWLIPYIFQNIEAGYVGDPHLLPGFRDIIELLGGQLRFGLITNQARHVKGCAGVTEDVNLLVGPRLRAFIRFVLSNVLDHDVRLLLTNNYGANFPLPETAIVEFGFPSIYSHALYQRPFLGYQGFMAFVDTLSNSLRQLELVKARAGFVRLEPKQ